MRIDKNRKQCATIDKRLEKNKWKQHIIQLSALVIFVFAIKLM